MPYSAHAIVESIIKKLGNSDLVTLVERGLRYGEKSGENSGEKAGKKSRQKFVKKSGKKSGKKFGEKFEVLPHFQSIIIILKNSCE